MLANAWLNSLEHALAGKPLHIKVPPTPPPSLLHHSTTVTFAHLNQIIRHFPKSLTFPNQLYHNDISLPQSNTSIIAQALSCSQTVTLIAGFLPCRPSSRTYKPFSNLQSTRIERFLASSPLLAILFHQNFLPWPDKLVALLRFQRWHSKQVALASFVSA